MTDVTEVLARAIREEIVRQYRENERASCPAGAAYYEEHISPELTAGAGLAALDAAGYQIVPKEPTDLMGAAGLKSYTDKTDPDYIAGNPSKWMKPAYRAMLAAAPKSTSQSRG